MIKYTVKLQLWEHETNEHNLHPIYIKITINRKTRYISTGIYIRSSMWDARSEAIKDSHPLAGTYNPDITTRKQKIISRIVEYQVAGKTVTAAEIKDQFKGPDSNNVFSFVRNYLSDVSDKRESSTVTNHEKHLKKLQEFIGSEKLSFEEITPEFLKRYESWLRKNVNFRKDDKHKNYIHAIWKTLKTWFNVARKRKIISHYPFNEYENPIYVRPDKDFLTKKELSKWEEFVDETNDPVLKEAGIYLLFGCYSGLRIGDWYKFDFEKHIKNNKLRLRPDKTKKKWIEMIISPPLKRNLQRMKEIPLILKEPTINEKIKIIASKKGIKKYVTTHSGRHTFAVTICLQNGISSETAANLMGISLQTFVDNYSQVTQEKIDKETSKAWENI